MRIVISNAGKDWRGTEADTLLLAQGLRAIGHDVLVFCRPNSALAQQLPDDIPRAPVLSARDFDLLAIARCMRALRRHRSQIVITQKDKDLRISGVAAWLLRTPVLVRHVTDRPLKKGWRYRFLFDRVATHHIANSNATRETLRASAPWLAADVPVIHNGIDVQRFAEADAAQLELPEDAIAVGFVGAFEMRKGILDFAAAWQQVASRVPNAHAVIAGAGAREQEFRAALQNEPRVRWLGFRKDTPNLMKALAVLVLPSRFEGFGLVLAEAMAAGVACVAYATSNIPELLEPDSTGLLVPAGDVDALAQAIVRLCRDGELRRGLGNAARVHAHQHFTAGRMVEEHERVLRKIMADRTMAKIALQESTVRATRRADLDHVLALLRTAALPTEGVADQFETGYAVAEVAGRIVGVAGVEVYERHGLLRSVAVDDANRGRGLGVALVRDRIAWARTRGLRDIHLLTTTAPGFFASLGFMRVARTDAPPALRQAPEFAYLCAETAVTMRLTL